MAKDYNTFTDVSTGDVYTAAAHNLILENVENYRVPPMVRVQRDGTNQSVTPGASGFVAWNNASAAFDTDSMWSSGANTRITVNTAGVYLVTWTLTTGWSGSAYGWYFVIDHRNSGGTLIGYPGSEYYYDNGSSMVFSYNATISCVVSASVGDYFQCRWDAFYGSATNPAFGGTYTHSLSAVWQGQVS